MQVPYTSRLAFRAVTESGAKARHTDKALEAFRSVVHVDPDTGVTTRHAGTSQSVAIAAGLKDEAARKRLPELADAGLLERTKLKGYTDSKCLCTVWRLTPLGRQALGIDAGIAYLDKIAKG